MISQFYQTKFMKMQQITPADCMLVQMVLAHLDIRPSGIRPSGSKPTKLM